MQYKEPTAPSGTTASRTNVSTTKGMLGSLGTQRCAPGRPEAGAASARFLRRSRPGTATYRYVQYYTEPNGLPLGEAGTAQPNDITYLDCASTTNDAAYDTNEQ